MYERGFKLSSKHFRIPDTHKQSVEVHKFKNFRGTKKAYSKCRFFFSWKWIIGET